MNQSDVLDSIAWAEKYFGALITNSVVPRRDVIRAVRKGLAKSIGLCIVCDDDGFNVEPERWREGFVLTDAGRQLQKGDSK